MDGKMERLKVGAPLVGARHKGIHEGGPYESGLVAARPHKRM